MPLSDAEIKWLEERKKYSGLEFCPHCAMKKNGAFPCAKWLINGFCPTVGGQDLRDAAEFEARVAANLAKKIPMAMRMSRVKDSDFIMNAETALALARLDVEEEMDQEAKTCRKD